MVGSQILLDKIKPYLRFADGRRDYGNRSMLGHRPDLSKNEISHTFVGPILVDRRAARGFLGLKSNTAVFLYEKPESRTESRQFLPLTKISARGSTETGGAEPGACGRYRGSKRTDQTVGRRQLTTPRPNGGLAQCLVTTGDRWAGNDGDQP